MTKKNIIALAEVLKSESFQASLQNAIPGRDAIATACIMGRIISAMSAYCKSQNSAFKEDHFRDYIAGKRNA